MPRKGKRAFKGKPFSSLQRQIDITDVKQTFLIVCEGEKTEPNYFRSFRISSARVQIVPASCDPETLVRRALEFNKASDEPFDQVWCVFDRDDCVRRRFNTALQLAARHGFLVACSIEAFELWFLLHFQYMDAALDRRQYIDILNGQLAVPYRKNSETIYAELLDHQTAAIKNGKRLFRNYGSEVDYDNNPSTTVFKLVEELNKYR